MGACGYRVVLDGDERSCNVTVPHTVHRYRTPDGRLHLFEIVPYGEG